jgi:hypothetical protein
MNGIQRRAVGVLSGVVVAVALAIGALVLLRLLGSVFPFADPEKMPRFAWLLIVVVPETIILLVAMRFWSKKRPMAVGILLSAVVLATHFVVHIATHNHMR